MGLIPLLTHISYWYSPNQKDIENSLANYEKTFYDFQINDINGEVINLKDYQGKAILLVNTASMCGFTKQYSGLQELHEEYKDKGLIVLGVPSNSFKQE